MKGIEFRGDSLDRLREFSEEAKDATGYQLHLVQKGEKPEGWKPMKTVGAGVNEIRINVEDGMYRTIYIAKFKEAVYVLHAFQKKDQKTRKADIKLAKSRLKELMKERK